jgi:hypothetical protein
MKALVIVVLFAALAGCSPALPDGEPGAPTAPIYVSIVCHNEEPKSAAAVAYSEDETHFRRNRDATVEFARMLHHESVKLNFQSDWDFVTGVLRYDHGSHSTGNKNVLQYLVYNLGFEVDPHAHEKRYNYADVAHLHEEAGVPVSCLAGGLIASPPRDSKLEYLWQPLQGAQFDCTWQAEAIWGGATGNHIDEESLWVSGVWKPQDDAHFTIHDEDAPLPHIGGYKADWEGLHHLMVRQAAGELDASKIHTQTIFIRQCDLLDTAHVLAFRDEIRALRRATEAGLVRWVGLAEVLGIWEEGYGSQPNLLSYR